VLALSLIRLVALTTLEKSDPAHVVSYRKVLPRDIMAATLFSFAVLPAADFLDRRIMLQPMLPSWVLDWAASDPHRTLCRAGRLRILLGP
jgi:hypothetical protein